MNIRNNIKSLCKLQGTTQKELAMKIGIKENTFNVMLKNGNPALKTLEKIAGALGVSLSELLSETDEIIPRVVIKEVSYLRCPNCGRKIEMYVKAEDENSNAEGDQ